MKSIFLTFFIGFLSISLFGQVTVTGFAKDGNTNAPIEGAIIKLGDQTAISDLSGYFKVQSETGSGELVLTIEMTDFQTVQINISAKDGKTQELGDIQLTSTIPSVLEDVEDRIPTISISGDELGADLDNQNISGLLTASRDVFVEAAAFTFGSTARFRIRGYDSENTMVSLNGVPMNELENGRVFWNAWGGLNDVTRNRQNSVGLGATSYAFGGVGGASDIDMRASNQWKQTRISYAISNRSYRNRIMVTHSTGLTPKGWALSASVSRRWADEGYVEGTPYDAYSYYLSIDKKWDKSLLSFAVIGSKNERGRSTGSTQEEYDLAGSNFYNPNWGYQNGEKRNARIQHTHQPIFMLTHDWNFGKTSKITSAVSYSFGRNGTTAVDWLNARDPRPNYYRNLPSFFYRNYPENPELGDAQMAAFLSGEKSLQLNWHELYEANRGTEDVIHNPNGVLGTTKEGFMAQYKIEDRRFDSEEFNANVIYENVVNDNLTLNGGFSVQKHKQHTHKRVVDLLGADFAMDWDNFSERDFFQIIDPRDQVFFSEFQEEIFLDNDIRNPNRILEEGDIFGYNYNLYMTKWSGWGQAQLTYDKVDLFFGANYSESSFWREGLFQNGRFPTRSLGTGGRASFKNVSAKAGLTYKLDGRNYLYVNGMYQTRAPFARHAFISPRTRFDLVPNLKNEKIASFEGGYILRGVKWKGRATAYFTQFKDQTEIIRYFTETGIGQTGFFNYVMTDQDLRHFGTELGIEYKLSPSISVSAVAAYGQYYHSSRPVRSGYNDTEVANQLNDVDNFVYALELRKAGTPQSAYTFEINWNPKELTLFGKSQRIFMSFNFNYFDDIYLDFAPERRTFATLEGIDQESQLFEDLVAQEQLPAAFTMDFFGGISFSRNLRLNAGVSNLLDKTDFSTGGFEQARLDFEALSPDTFPPRYFYSFGRNYFISLTYRL